MDSHDHHAAAGALETLVDLLSSCWSATDALPDAMPEGDDHSVLIRTRRKDLRGALDVSRRLQEFMGDQDDGTGPVATLRAALARLAELEQYDARRASIQAAILFRAAGVPASSGKESSWVQEIGLRIERGTLNPLPIDVATLPPEPGE